LITLTIVGEEYGRLSYHGPYHLFNKKKRFSNYVHASLVVCLMATLEFVFRQVNN